MRHLSLVWLTLLLGLTAARAVGQAPTPDTIEINGFGTDPGESPVVLPVSSKLAPGLYRFVAKDGTTPPVPAQVFDQTGGRFVAFIVDHVAAAGKVVGQLVPASTSSADPAPAPGVKLTAEGRRVKVAVGGEPLTEYIPDDGPKPFLYPLLGPKGAEMTRSFPMKKVDGETLDHPHHRSLWYAHGSVNGVDFWSILPGAGSIRETSRMPLVDGPVVGVIQTADDWLDAGGKLVATDERVVRFYATRKARVLDFDVNLRAPANGPAVVLGDTKEGTFALRVATSMDVTAKKGGKIVTSDGLVDKAAWGKPAAWVDYTGPVGGQTLGIAVLNHPSSFRFPTTWHVRDYGLFAANPFGWHDFGRKETGQTTIAPGESLHFGYRIILHEGATDPAHLNQAASAYASLTVTSPK